MEERTLLLVESASNSSYETAKCEPHLHVRTCKWMSPEVEAGLTGNSHRLDSGMGYGYLELSNYAVPRVKGTV